MLTADAKGCLFEWFALSQETLTGLQKHQLAEAKGSVKTINYASKNNPLVPGNRPGDPLRTSRNNGGGMTGAKQPGVGNRGAKSTGAAAGAAPSEQSSFVPRWMDPHILLHQNKPVNNVSVGMPWYDMRELRGCRFLLQVPLSERTAPTAGPGEGTMCQSQS